MPPLCSPGGKVSQRLTALIWVGRHVHSAKGDRLELEFGSHSTKLMPRRIRHAQHAPLILRVIRGVDVAAFRLVWRHPCASSTC